jgi:hypothetical protein
MKYFLPIVMLFLFSCREKPQQTTDTPKEVSTDTVKNKENRYPSALIQVFDAHGGLAAWKGKKRMSFQINDPAGTQTHTIDLSSRRDRIDAKDHSIGFDGQQVWLWEKGSPYKGDAVFYHNLMFYFHAMPFVLADKGTVYTETPDLEFEGNRYPGVRIGFKPGVGTSSKDEYYLHFDPQTHRMAWLGYTVSYGKETASDEIHWIRYDKWSEVEGILLPKAITWYAAQGRTLKEALNTVVFDKMELAMEEVPASFFEKPAEADFVAGKAQDQ